MPERHHPLTMAECRGQLSPSTEEPTTYSLPSPPAPVLILGFHRRTKPQWRSQQSEAATETSPLCQEEFMKPVTPLCQEVRGAQPLITASLSAWRPIIFILSYLMGCLQAVKARRPQLNTRKHNRTLSFYGPFIGELRQQSGSAEDTCYFVIMGRLRSCPRIEPAQGLIKSPISARGFEGLPGYKRKLFFFFFLD